MGGQETGGAWSKTGLPVPPSPGLKPPLAMIGYKLQATFKH